jgi:hypothetical protein
MHSNQVYLIVGGSALVRPAALPPPEDTPNAPSWMIQEVPKNSEGADPSGGTFLV